MTEHFLNYDQSLVVKELGFNEPCLAYWNIDPYLPKPTFNLVKPFDHEWCVPAPLKQQVFRWFRDKKLADGSVCRHGKADGGYSYRWDIVYEYGVYEERHFKQDYKTYEEAEDACIDKIIKLIKKH